MLKRSVLPLLWGIAVMALVHLGPTPAEVGDLPTGTALAAQADDVLPVVAAGLAWLLLGWVALGFVVVVGGHGAGRTARWCRATASRVLPRALRRGLETALGVTVVAATATPALAAPDGLPDLDRRPATAIQLAPLPDVPAPVLAEPTASPVPLPDLDRSVEQAAGAPSAPAPAADPVLGTAPPADAPEVVVRRGDCLWSVVARALGPNASDADVAEAWPSWYAANRAVIGPDPSLVLPGQRLAAPARSP